MATHAHSLQNALFKTCVWCVMLLALPRFLQAQTTYHLHAEASSTPSRLQLKKAAPDQASVAFQSANLQGAATGIYVVKEFDTQAGDPGVTGTIPSGSQVTFSVWMRSTAALGSMFPSVDLRRNGPTDQPVCSRTGTTALTITLAQYSLTCTTTADVNLTGTDRLYLAVDVNLTTGNSSGPFAGEVDIEGVSGGMTDSQFTIPAFNTNPKISSLTPNSGAIGSEVLVAGANFGVTQLGSTVTLGLTAVTPLSWGNTLIRFLVPSSASTGNVTVKVGGVSSNAVKLTVTPGISSLSPSKGATGGSVTITGTKFGTVKGSVTFNGITALTTSWANTKIVATVPATATTGPVVVTVGTLLSNPVPFNVNSCTVSSIAISPHSYNLLLGQGHALTAFNNCGQPLTGVTWTVADPNTAYVTAGTLPELVAQNAGSTILTASYQGSSDQATVTVYSGPSLPSGTVLWSPPPSVGYTGLAMIPGVPTNNTPSFFFIERNSSQQTLVHGISLDGTTLWVTPGPVTSFGTPFTPDNDGGIVISPDGNKNVTTKIDGSGNQVWYYQTPTFAGGRPTIAEDGTVYITEGSSTTHFYLLALDGGTGIPRSRAEFPLFNLNQGISVGPTSVMPDGTAYVEAIYPQANGLPQQVWLIGLTSNGAASQQVLQTTGLVVTQSPGLVIPDGNGGVLATWSGQTLNILDIGGSGSGIYASLSTSQQAVLGDTGAAYFLGTNASTNNVSILAVNTTTGASLWQWDFPAGHGGTLTTSQAGGGVVAVDSNQSGTQQNVVRLDINGIATYDTWTAGAGSLDYYGDDLWFDAGTQLAIAASPVTVADTDWINPRGNERQQARPPKKVKFQEDVANHPCSGVDDTTKDSTWMMVPVSGTNNGAKVHIRGNQQDVQFVSEDATIATISPTAPTGKDTAVTVSGLKSGQITTIDARSISNPTHNYAQLKVVVKPRLSKTLDMFTIIDPVKNLTPKNVPTSASLQTYLNGTIWGKQANVYFDTVNSPVNVSVHYDLLPTGGDGFLNDFQRAGANLTETSAIQTAVSAINPNTGQQNRLEIDYANQFGPPINGTWVANYHVEGESFTGAFVSFVEDFPSTPPFNSRENISAHEIGHAMGAQHTYKMSSKDPVNKSVMYHGLESTTDPINPCEVRRAAWGAVNPTPGDDGTTH